MSRDQRGNRSSRTRRAAVGLVTLVAVLLVIVLVTSGGRRSRPSSRREAPTATSSTATTTSPAPLATPTGGPALPAPATPALGISVNRLFLDRTYTGPQIDAQLQALAATGATDARSDALWEATEPNPPAHGVHRYDWTFDDGIAAPLAAHRQRWLPIIDYSALWAESLPGQEHSAPSLPQDYAAYAAAFAARYGAGGTFWREHPGLPARPVTTLEIWNEPDGGLFWLPRPQPRAYADLYASARAAVEAVQPGIRVIVGGLTNLPGFMPALLTARPDLRGRIDGIGVHLYKPNPLAMLQAVKSDRGVLDALGLPSVPLYVTEFGWTPRPPGATGWLPARLRPGYIKVTTDALAHTDCSIGGLYLYTWVTPERNPNDGNDWFGIHPPRHGGSTASQDAFAAGLRLARAPRTPLRLC